MIILTDTVEIPAPFEKLVDWVDHFETEFVQWSPHHLECQLLDGGIGVGDRVRFYEIVEGIDYDVTGTITTAERDADHFLFTFRAMSGLATITFEGRRTPTGCRFRHTEGFGLATPVIGPLINAILFKIVFRRLAKWQVIKDDMVLDGRYLRDILAEGRYPERIPLSELRIQNGWAHPSDPEDDS